MLLLDLAAVVAHRRGAGCPTGQADRAPRSPPRGQRPATECARRHPRVAGAPRSVASPRRTPGGSPGRPPVCRRARARTAVARRPCRWWVQAARCPPWVLDVAGVVDWETSRPSAGPDASERSSRSGLSQPPAVYDGCGGDRGLSRRNPPRPIAPGCCDEYLREVAAYYPKARARSRRLPPAGGARLILASSMTPARTRATEAFRVGRGVSRRRQPSGAA